MTGKLTQTMRESAETLTDKEYKYIINSILAAVDFSKIDPNTKKSFSAKINGDNGGGEEAQPQQQPTPQGTGDLSETDEDPHSQPTQQTTPQTELMNSNVVKELINSAGLDSSDSESLAFDVAEAIYVYRQDYNEDTPFFHYLNNLISRVNFRPSLTSYNSLDPEGKEIYLALVQYGESNGNAEKINEEMKSIYNKMINEIKRKLIKK